MRKHSLRVKRAIADLCYDVSCALYRLNPIKSSRQGSGMKSQKRKDMLFYCGMMAIPLFQFCMMWLGVNVNSLLLSFKEYDVGSHFIWTLDNFANVIQGFSNDDFLRQSLLNSILFYVITTVVTLPTSMIISFYFYKKYPFSGALKIILFVPSAISSVVTITCFYYLADRGWPMLMKLLTGQPDVMGLLVNSQTRLPAMFGYNIFYSLAGSFLFYSSAMSGIDNSISEAAHIDGANMVQEFLHVTLPMIYPMFSTFLVAGLAGSMIGDYGMYAFSRVSGSVIPSMGYFFTSGITAAGAERRYPYFAALGLVLSAMTCVVVFSARAIINRFDPFRDKKPKKVAAR